MSRVKLLGFAHKQGEYEGRAYNSVKLHISEPFYDDGRSESYGEEVSVATVKYDRFPYVTDRLLMLDELAPYVGTEMEIYYDKNKQVSHIHFYADDEKPESKKQ